MTVRELIEQLQALPPNAEVITNECEATNAHETIVALDTVEVVDKGFVYVGTGEAREISRVWGLDLG